MRTPTACRSSSTTAPPGAAVPFPLLERAAAAHGFRVLGYSRPGYGASTPWPFSERGPRIVDDAVDSLIVLYHLGVEEFATLGWSGGGPRALACAALAPERCRAVATLASVAPYDAAGLDWTHGMAEENVEEFAAAVRGATAYHQFLRALPEPEGDRTPEQMAEDLGGLLTPVDAAFVTGEFAAYMDALRAPRPAAGRGRLARRRPGNSPRVGVRPRGDRGASRGVARQARRDGAVRPR